MRQSRLPFEAASFQAKRILVDGQVGLGDLRPGFAAGGCGATAILVIKRRGWPPLIGNVLSACRFGGHANPLLHHPPVEDLAMGRIAEIESFLGMLPAKPLGVTPGRHRHGFQRFGIPEVADLGHDHVCDVLLDGHADENDQTAGRRLNAQRKRGRESWPIWRLQPVNSSDQEFLLRVFRSSGGAGFRGLDGQALAGLLGTRGTGSPMQVSLNGQDRQSSRRMCRVDSYLDVFGGQNGGNGKQQEKKWGPDFHGFFFICSHSSKTECATIAASTPRPGEYKQPWRSPAGLRERSQRRYHAFAGCSWPTLFPSF